MGKIYDQNDHVDNYFYNKVFFREKKRPLARATDLIVRRIAHAHGARVRPLSVPWKQSAYREGGGCTVLTFQLRRGNFEVVAGKEEKKLVV